MATTSSALQQLPHELLAAISNGLPNRDIKSLRLTCKALCVTSQLRWERVFLSANPRNIEVFRAIADHEEIRRLISEIVWDDALLRDGPLPEKPPRPPWINFVHNPWFDDDGEDEDEIDDTDDIDGDENEDDSSSSSSSEDQDEDEDKAEEPQDDVKDQDSNNDDDEEERLPSWFVKACEGNLRDIRIYLGLRQPDQFTLTKLSSETSMEGSWKYYQQLLLQQRDVLATNSDADAFEYGLQRFPALRRVTITPVAHGWLPRPLYETPMIRAFPLGFNYPIPCSWPVRELFQKPWEMASEDDKNIWRGFRFATRALAAIRAASQQQQVHGITELVINVNQMLTGLNAHMFGQECAEQSNLATILRHPNFQRLDLALALGGQELVDYRAFRSGLLRQMLKAALAIEHVSLTTDMANFPMPRSVIDGGPEPRHFVPLRDIFPVECWTRLRYFRLSRFLVRQDDLFSFLAALPPTLRSIELTFLLFRRGNYRDLFTDVRDQLRWRERPAEQRPSVVIAMRDNRPRRGLWLGGIVNDFLYNDGPNPFVADQGKMVALGCGAVYKDAVDPDFERPYAQLSELVRLGYLPGRAPSGGP